MGGGGGLHFITLDTLVLPNDNKGTSLHDVKANEISLHNRKFVNEYLSWKR